MGLGEWMGMFIGLGLGLSNGCGTRERPHYGLNQIVNSGQSLAVGVNGDPALSTTQPYANKMFVGGVRTTNLASLVPLIEGTDPAVETHCSAAANLMTELTSHDFLMSNAGVTATPYSGLKKGTVPYTLSIDQVTAGKSLAEGGALTHGVTGIFIVHGEADANAGSTTYDADMAEWFTDYNADIKAITGQTEVIPMFHSQVSSFPDSDVPPAQLRASLANPNLVLVGPKYQLEYAPDLVHLSNHGYQQMGEYYSKAYDKVRRGERGLPLYPTSIVRNGATVDVTFHVPVPPLVLDTTLVVAAEGMGFIWVNDPEGDILASQVGQTPSTSVVLTGSNSVRITLQSDPGAPGRLAYAQKAGHQRGNLRDSDTTVTSRLGYDLYNWCVHFDEDVS